MRRYELIIFDWDGTLMDSADDIVFCVQKAAADLGEPDMPAAVVQQIIGLGLAEAVEQLFPNRGEQFCTELADRYRHHYHQCDIRSDLFPQVPQVLEKLKSQNYLLAVATGKSRRGLDSVLTQTGMRDYFQVTRCADESGSKPDPAMLVHILSVLAVAPERALMVGDTEFDLAMAKSAKVDSVGVSYGVHSVDQLRDHQPIAIIEKLEELLTII